MAGYVLRHGVLEPPQHKENAIPLTLGLWQSVRENGTREEKSRMKEEDNPLYIKKKRLLSCKSSGSDIPSVVGLVWEAPCK